MVNHGSISGLHHLRLLFQNFTTTTIDLLSKFSELASNVSSVAIQHWLVSSMDLTRMVQNNNLCKEAFGLFGRILLAVRSNHTTFDILDGTSLNTSHGNSSNTTNLVHILKWESEWFVLRTFRLSNSLQQGLSSEFSIFSFNVPSLVPGHVGRCLNHVV